MKRILILLAILTWGLSARAQTDFVVGTLTATAATCASTGIDNSHVATYSVGFGGAVFTVVAGAWNGTISFFGSGDGGNNWNPMGVTPSAGGSPVVMASGTGGATTQVFQSNPSAYTHVCMVMTANTSGSVVAKIHLSPISARVGGGGGGATSLSSLTAATTTPAALNNGPNNITWNWTNPSAGNSFSIGETAASTGGTVTAGVNNQAILAALTQPGSTATPLSVVQGALSGTVATPALQVQTTWNNAATTFSGITESVTNTMSNASSSLLNLLVGGTSAFNVTANGSLTSTGTLSGNTGLSTNGGVYAFSGLTVGTGVNYATPALRAAVTTTPIILSGGFDSNTASTSLGGIILKGANSSIGNGTVTAGGAVLQGGYITVTPYGGVYGMVQVMAGYLRGTAIATQGDIVCGTTTAFTVTDCPATTGTNIIGIAAGTASPVGVVVDGTVPVRLDAAMTAIGDIVCLSTTTAGLGHDNGTALCTNAGTQIGIIIANTGNGQFGPTGGSYGLTNSALSTTLPLVQLHFR